jgi:hypothetical protein
MDMHTAISVGLGFAKLNEKPAVIFPSKQNIDTNRSGSLLINIFTWHSYWIRCKIKRSYLKRISSGSTIIPCEIYNLYFLKE